MLSLAMYLPCPVINPRRGKITKWINEKIIEQDGKCAICGKTEKLVVDHDHETGKIRGMLCNKCNTAIGLLGDSLDGVKLALNYLTQERNHK